MRIALLADIHGNLLALEAALADVRRQSVDQIIVAGDIVLGAPDSAACWDRVAALGCPVVRGNHERYVSDYGTPRADPGWSSRQFAPIAYAAEQIGPARRAAAAALPHSLTPPDAPGLLVVHASQRSDRDSLRPHTPDEELPACFPDPAEATLILRGHNHIASERAWDRRRIVTVGSVGLPLDGSPTAQYLLADRGRDGWRVTHRAVPYDLDAALRRFETSGYLREVGPIARLYYRELATATLQIEPFLRYWRRWQAEGPIGLDAAYERFCQLAL